MQRVLPLLRTAGIEVEVHVMAFGGKPGVNCAFFSEHGIPFHWISWQAHLPSAVRFYLRLLKRSRPDVYVPNRIVPAYFAAGCARCSGIPTVEILYSDGPFYWGLVEEIIEGRPDFLVSAVVPVSNYLESDRIDD